MLIFVYGEDGYRLHEQVAKLVAEYQKKNKSGLNLLRFDFAEGDTSAEQLSESLRTTGFFKEKKLVVIHELFHSGQANKVLETLQTFSIEKEADVIAVFIEPYNGETLAAKNKKLYAYLTAKGDLTKEIELLDPKKLLSWVTAELNHLDKIIEPPAAKLLIELTQPANKDLRPLQTWRLNQELQKLANYVSADKITIADVEALVVPEIDQNIFALTDALAERNAVRSYSLLYRALNNSEEPHGLWAMFVRQFRNLLTVKALSKEQTPFGDLARLTGLHPYVVRKTFDQAKRFDLDELKRKFLRLAAIEVSAKSGETDLTDELFSLTLTA